MLYRCIKYILTFCRRTGQLPPSHGGSMYPRGNSRSATATPTGSPKRRLPQIPGQGLPPTNSVAAASSSNRMGSRLRGGAEAVAYHASYDGGLNHGGPHMQPQQRGQSLHPSTRSRSMGHYGGYSDTEVMVQDQRYYDSQSGRGPGYHNQQGQYPGQATTQQDPYYENTRVSQGYATDNAYPIEDRRAQPPPPPPRNVNFEGDPPIKSSGGPRGAPPVGRSIHYGDSDMESVTSALSSHSAPHQRPRRPG
jgi:hypothetical protein